MSKVKISKNLFLEVNELNRLVKSLEDDGYKRILRNLITKYGIVRDENNTYFKVTKNSGTTNVITINAGLAFDSNLNAIVLTEDKQFQINDTNQNRWLVISHAVTNYETGRVNIAADGSISGAGTMFTEVLRGQPNFPVKVKFNSTNNPDEYEVVSVTNNTSALISGELVAENNVQYAVVGTFTPGFQVDEANKMIYEYDDCEISIIDSASRPDLPQTQFIIAKLYFESGDLVVEDERIYSMFNTEYNQTVEYNSELENPICSLLGISVIGGNVEHSMAATFELIFEHGYKITNSEVQQTATDNIVTIQSGSCNFLGSGDIPDHMFDGWLLLNRTNMRYVVITEQLNKVLHIAEYDPELMGGGIIDLVVVPNCNGVEYEITLNNNVNSPSVPFRFKFDVENIRNRVHLSVFYPSVNETFIDVVNMKLRYRLISKTENLNRFYNLAVAEFIDINGESVVMGNSDIDVDMSAIEPEITIRNYS